MKNTFSNCFPLLYIQDTRYKICISQFHSLYIWNNNTLTTYIDTLVEMGGAA